MATVICHDIHGNTHPTPITFLQWRPSAYAIIIKSAPTTGPQILLLKQFSGYDLPGGALNIGEDPKTAVVREAKEETGLDVAVTRLLGVESSLFRSSHTDGKCWHSLLMYFKCDVAGEGEMGKERFDEWEREYVDGVEWVDVKALEKVEVSSTVDWRGYVREAGMEREHTLND